ncbi:hypothetical protein SB782_36655, partial [Brevibacillus sp. SIMBA_076]|uniref:hypothetical protein n=1 Tax=Brevibacillus sp. SIMBA_076 TaxID=3085814 RepID=UPI00397E3FDD
MAVEPDNAGVRFPPPFVYLGALLLGLLAERLVPLHTFGIEWRLLTVTGGLLLGVIGNYGQILLGDSQWTD